MKYYYSAKHNGFFHDTRGAYGVHWPADAVEVTESQFRTYALGMAPEGKALGPDKTGFPMWVTAGESRGMTPPQQADLMGAWVTEALDVRAQAYGYDHMLSAVSWAGDSDTFLAAEGNAFKAWRSAVWRAAVPLIEQVRNGTRDIPIKAEFIEKLPAYKPPAGARLMKD